MIRTAVRYLLRIDDLCPGVSHERWREFRALIEEFRLQPILAVVPDNHDPALQFSKPDSSFWSQIRILESAGATIGLHGFRHLCLSRGRSLLGLHRTSEFAGIPANAQRAWIRDGLRILRGHGLDPRVFVPPRHGFDLHTLAAIRSEGIPLLSDGFAHSAFLRGGVIWIPQQLWAPVEKPSGTWTICIHPNTARDDEIAGVRAFLRAHFRQFTSVDRLLASESPAPLKLFERIQAELALRRVLLSRALEPVRRLSALRASNPV
jgi:predicted deacetylase